MPNLMISLPACRNPTKKVRPFVTDSVLLQPQALPENPTPPNFDVSVSTACRPGVVPTGKRCSFVAVILAVVVGVVPVHSQSTDQDPLRQLNQSIARLTERVTPSVVQIQSTSYAPATPGRGAVAVALRPTMGSGVIYSVNNRYLETLDELSTVIEGYQAGDTVVLQIERGGCLSYIEVELD